jgi:hypothetical protein
MWYRCCSCVAILAIIVIFLPSATHAQPMRLPESPANEKLMPGVEPGYLGMVADDREENGYGIRVQDVDLDSPAAKAGLQTNDLITAVNGQNIRSAEELSDMLRPLQAGAKISFQIERQSASQTVDVTLGQRPPPEQRRFQSFGHLPEGPTGDEPAQMPPATPTPTPTGEMPAPAISNASLPRPLLGVRTMPVTDQDRVRLRLPATAGAHVMDRTPGSPAVRANIPVDAVITALDGAPVGSPNDLSVLLSRAGAGKEVDLTYVYNGNQVQTKVILGFDAASRDTGRSAGGGYPAPSPSLSSSPNVPPPAPTPSGNQSPPNSTPPQYRSVPRSADAQRIDAMDQRIQQLEQRVQELESRK